MSSVSVIVFSVCSYGSNFTATLKMLMKILHGQLEDSLKKAKIKSEAIGKWEILAYACLSFCFLVNGYDNIDNTFLHGVT